MTEFDEPTQLVKTETALVLSRQEELTLAVRARADAYVKSTRAENISIFGMISGIGGFAATAACLIGVLHPVGAIIGAAVLLSGGGSAIWAKKKDKKETKKYYAADREIGAIESAIARESYARERERQTQEARITAERIAHLQSAAEVALDQALVLVPAETGLEVPFTTEDQSQKIIRIESVDPRALFKTNAVERTTIITARIYNAVTQDDGEWDRGDPMPDMPAFKRTVGARLDKILPR